MENFAILLNALLRWGGSKAKIPTVNRLKTGMLFVGAAAFYVACLPRFFVGYFNDDAAYILAAKSFLLGHYSSLYLPHPAPLTHFLPGYPLFLVPFVFLMQPHWSFLRFVNLGLTVGTGSLLWGFTRDILPPKSRLLLLALFAFNPIIGEYSGSVMSDPCLLFAVMLCFFLLPRVLQNSETGLTWILGLALAWGALIRPIGAILIPSIVAGLILSRRWRAAAIAGGLASVIWLSVLVLNYRLGHTATDYLSFWGGSQHYFLSHPARLFQNLLFVADYFVTRVVFCFPFLPLYGGGAVISTALALGAAVLLVLGWRDGIRKAVPQKSIALSAAIFLILYGAVLAFWSVSEDRYFMPILPIALVFIWDGIRRLARLRQRWLMVAATLWMIAVLSESIFLLKETYSPSRPPESRFPQHTLEWIRQQTPPQAIFLGKAPMLYLYTERKAISGGAARDREDYRSRVLHANVDYIYLQPRRLLSLRGAASIDQAAIALAMQQWTMSWPEAFQRVYENPDEGTLIYRVRKPA